MTTGLLLYVAVMIGLAAIAGWAAEALCRQLGRPARWAWPAASMMALVLIAGAVSESAHGAVPVSYPRVALPAPLSVPASAWTPMQALRGAAALSSAAIAAAMAVVVRAVPARLATVAAVLWVSVSLLALVVLALVHLRLRRARREWAEAELFGTRVRIAPAVGPAVVGLMRPQIVVPRWLLSRSVDEQQLVLAHEREHLGARDHLLLSAGCLLVALVPWHPAAWWMLARLRLAIELDCDARVLRRGVPARTYGTLLIDLAGRCTGFRVGATALADEGSHLERRLLAMKTTATKRSLLRAGTLATAAALALLAACEARVPTGPEIDAMDVASASKAMTSTRLLQKSQMDSAVFYVDGVLVDSRTANALTPNQIATIDISKATERPIIRIRTNGQTPAAISNEGGAMRMRTAKLADTLRVAVQGAKDTAAKKFDGLLLIDGVKVDASALASLDKNRVESIEVLKGAAAEKLYPDAAAKNGVILVTTKK